MAGLPGDIGKCSICKGTITMTAWGESCRCTRERAKQWKKQLKFNKIMRKSVGMKW